LSEVVSLREWQTVGPAENASLSKRYPFSAHDREVIANLAYSRRLEVLEVRDGLRITTTSFVGVVHLGSLTLQIRPKLAELSPGAMATILCYALGLESAYRWNREAAVCLEAGEFGGLLARILVEEVDLLLRAGLQRDYQARAVWRQSPRGRLDLPELARHPSRGGPLLAIPCCVSERGADIALNRLVLAALDAASALAADPDTAFQLQSRSALLIDGCRQMPLTRSLWEEAAAAMGRRSERYQSILQLADLLLNGAGASVGDSGRIVSLSSFLVDMNLVFERLVSRLLSDFGPHGARVETQVSRTRSFRWSENPHGWQRPRLRPDIVVYDRATNQPNMILDAKYKPISAVRRPPPEDLYQLTLYSLSFGGRATITTRIVYPTLSDRSNGSQPRLEFYGASRSRSMASVGFFGLPMLRVAKALHRNDSAYLRQLAFALTSQ